MPQAERYVDINFPILSAHLTGKIEREIEITLALLRQSVHKHQ
jgi:hypothetical protein